MYPKQDYWIKYPSFLVHPRCSNNSRLLSPEFYWLLNSETYLWFLVDSNTTIRLESEVFHGTSPLQPPHQTWDFSRKFAQIGSHWGINSKRILQCNLWYPLHASFPPTFGSLLNGKWNPLTDQRLETFSLYLWRLQEFIACKCLAARTYTESKELDLAVRNISAEWHSDFHHVVECNKSTGKGGTLPFKLVLPQITTTFVEYANEIGHEAPGSHFSPTTNCSTPAAIMRRLETTLKEEAADGTFLPDKDVDLIINAIAQTQQSSNWIALMCTRNRAGLALLE